MSRSRLSALLLLVIGPSYLLRLLPPRFSNRRGRKQAGSDDDSDEDSEEDSSEESSEDEPTIATARVTGITADPKKAAAFGNTEPLVDESQSRAAKKAAKIAAKQKAADKKKMAADSESEEESSEEEQRPIKGATKAMGGMSMQAKPKAPAASSSRAPEEMSRRER